MKISDAKNLIEFNSCIDQECFIHILLFIITIIVNAGIVCGSINYFANLISKISLFLGLVGTIFVGYSPFSSRKATYEYSLTTVGFNPEKVKIILNSRLCTSIGTIFYFIINIRAV